MKNSGKNIKPNLVPDEIIVNKIYLIRGQKVMIDADLAELYNVTTGNLNKAVKRNLRRFPKDFMFQLSHEEYENLIFQIGISSSKSKPMSKAEAKTWGGRRVLPFAFTENGVAMLSSILNTDIAVDVNIRIIRIFTRLREALMNNADILLRLEQLEKKVMPNSYEIEMIFKALKEMLITQPAGHSKIGFQLRK